MYLFIFLQFLFENVCVLPRERRKDRKKKEYGRKVNLFQAFLGYIKYTQSSNLL